MDSLYSTRAASTAALSRSDISKLSSLRASPSQIALTRRSVHCRGRPRNSSIGSLRSTRFSASRIMLTQTFAGRPARRGHVSCRSAWATATSDIARTLGKTSNMSGFSFDRFKPIERADTEKPMKEIRTAVLADTMRGLVGISIVALAGAEVRARDQHGLAPTLKVATHRRSVVDDRRCAGHFMKPAPVRAAVMRPRL